MRSIQCFVFILGLFLSLLPSALRANMPAYIGEWQVDIPATMEYLKGNPKYRPSDESNYATQVTNTAKSMTLNIDDHQVQLVRGNRTTNLPYKPIEESINKAVVEFNIDGQKGRLTFTQTAIKRINFTSTVSEEMNFYVWKPTSASERKRTETTRHGIAAGGTRDKPSIETNLNEIVFCAVTYQLENGVDSVTYAELLKNGDLAPLKSINGEDYTKTKIDLKNRSASVVDANGKTHIFKR